MPPVKQDRRKIEPNGHTGIKAVAAWGSEAGEVCELALAHVNDNRTEAAYRRSDLFEKRRDLMEDWAAYLDDSLSQGGWPKLGVEK